MATELGPEDLIRSTSAHVLKEIKSNSELFQQDPAKLYALVGEVVLPHFDFEGMIGAIIALYTSEGPLCSPGGPLSS